MADTMNRGETNLPYDQTSSGSSTGVVTALFDDRSSAERAVSWLVEMGLPQSRVGIVHDQSGDSYASYADGREEKGFWASFADLFSTSDQSTYSEGLRRGGYLVTAEITDPSQEDRITDILEDAGATDIDEKSAGWRAQGWHDDSVVSTSSHSTAAGMMGSSGTGAARDSAIPLAAGSHHTATASTTEQAPVSGTTGDDVIPIAEEELRVGKRQAGGRRVRVHTRVVEKPVEEQVTLREEHVSVDRRPASSMSMKQGNTDELFKERSVEVQAMREEAVVSKEAHVTEEVVVGKSVEEHTETVRDTVRHTEVDVDDGHETTGGSTASAMPDAKDHSKRI